MTDSSANPADGRHGASEVIEALRRRYDPLKRFAFAIMPNTGPIPKIPDVSGSGSLVRLPEATILLTAAHVWEDLQPYEEWRLGNLVVPRALLEPARINRQRDLASIVLRDAFDISEIGTDIIESSSRIVRAQKTATIAVGYPRHYAIVDDEISQAIISPYLRMKQGFLEFEADDRMTDLHLLGTKYTDDFLTIDLKSAAEIDLKKLDGMSGGPAFQFIGEHLELVGVLSSAVYSSEKRSYWICDFQVLHEDGSIDPDLA